MGCFFIVDQTGFIAGPSSRMAPISITDGEIFLPDTSLPNTARTRRLRRRFAAEEWAMPEDGPPMKGALPRGTAI
jgi:hypothetical protein